MGFLLYSTGVILYVILLAINKVEANFINFMLYLLSVYLLGFSGMVKDD